MQKIKTILLSGATGFLGSYLCQQLLKSGYNVVILKRSTSNIWRIEHLMHRLKSYDVDVESIENAFKEQSIDTVIHTACHQGRSGASISEIAQTNIMLGLNILDACLEFNVNTFLNTDTLLHKNLNNYAMSKKQFMEWLTKSSDKIQVINLKLELIYGPKDDKSKFVSWIISQLIDNVNNIELTKGNQQRDFIFVEDAVSAYITLLEKAHQLPQFSEFDIGTGELITIKSFLVQLKDCYENKFGKTETKLDFGAIPYRADEVMKTKIDNNPLVNLGWKPNVNLKKGLTKTIQYFSDNK